MTDRHPVFALADRFVDEVAAAAPIVATYAGIAGHDHEWGDLGPDGVEARAALWRRTLGDLDALPQAEAPDDVLAVRTLRELLEEELDRHEHDDHLRDIAHMGSTVPELRDVLDVQDIGDPAGQEALLRRLTALPDALAGWRSLVEVALDRDVVVARRQVDSVARQLRAAAGPNGAFAGCVARLAGNAPALAAEAEACVPGIVAACEKTAHFLEEVYAPQAGEVDGVGMDHYQRAARHLLGTTIDLHETYAWGWERVRTLLARAEGVAARVDPTTNLQGVVHRLKTDPTFAAPSPEAFRELMVARQHTALDVLAGSHFAVPDPVRHVEVRLAPPGVPVGATYTGPSEDFSRPGAIWWALGDRQPVPLFEEVSTAYHEGFPGHHLQVGVQLSLGDRLSRAHRLLCWNPGYGEGWALYAETFMDELGYLEEPHFELGYLTSSLLRALRVVIDLGLHLDLPIPDDAPLRPGGRWSFDLAVDALERLTGLDHEYASSEVTRYLGWPAQAISYALGERVILELREERRARDRADFDLTAFHADVLGSGPVGLDHLRELVLA